MRASLAGGGSRFVIERVRTHFLRSEFGGYSLAPNEAHSRLNRGHAPSDMAGMPLEVGLRAPGNCFHDADENSAVNVSTQRLSVTSAVAKEIAQTVVFVI